jgi:carboxyl-terminal processing protease
MAPETGARLQKKNDYTTDLISGGPGLERKRIRSRRCSHVAQGKEEPVDIVGMRLDDVVKKKSRTKDTEALTVKKTDGSIKSR